MDFSNGLVLILMLVAGGAVGYLASKLLAGKSESEVPKLRIQLQLEQEKNQSLSSAIQELNKQLKDERDRVILLSSQNATLNAHYKNLQERLDEQKQEVTQLQNRFAHEFKNLANEIFEEKSKKFTDQNKVNLDSLLKPLGEKLTEFERKVEQGNKESLQQNSALREQLLHLRDLNQKMSKEAENLTKALKGDTKVQGNWGEMILERILEQSGLEKDREYTIQESINTEDGRRLRPDVIIRLPDSKNLIIDSKASLTAYERFSTAETEEEREQHLKDHLLSVRAHIKGLSEKKYQALFETGSLDYVLMFIPIEAAFGLLVQRGGDLYNEAHQKNIIIVSPTTLIATLRTVSSIWKHEYQNRNALEIARQGGALYDKFKSFVDDLVEVGKALDRSKQQYSEAMGKLVTGKDNLIRKTERLKELGAKTSKDMNEKLLERAEAGEKKSISGPGNLFG